MLALMLLWDGLEWKGWAPAAPGKVVEIKLVDAARSHYLAKAAARSDDAHIPLLEFMWQQASWPEVAREVTGLTDDLHLLATCAAKLEHFYEFRGRVDGTLLASFVRSEIEHALVVAGSVFDLFQAAVARFWNERFQLTDAGAEALRKQHPLPDTFSTVVFEGGKARTASELVGRYGMPAGIAAAYVNHIPIFTSLRASRDGVVHFGSTVDHVFMTERGFAISPTSRDYRDFPWKAEHHYNEAIASLMPWIARVVFGPLDACTEILTAYRSVLQFPPGDRSGISCLHP